MSTTGNSEKTNEGVGVNPPMTPTPKARPLRARLPSGKPLGDLHVRYAQVD